MADAAPLKVLPSKKVNCGVHSAADRGHELYPTPPQLTRALLKSGEHLPHRIWEPMCGMGHMVQPLVAAGHRVVASDLHDYGWPGCPFTQGDFFAYDAAPRVWGAAQTYDCIVTNPAFSLSAKFVRHALTLVNKVIILNRLAFLETSGRSDIIDHHLVRVYPFVERPPMMHRWTLENGVWTEWSGNRATSAMPVAWFVFERKRDPGVPITLKRISWRKP